MAKAKPVAKFFKGADVAKNQPSGTKGRQDQPQGADPKYGNHSARAPLAKQKQPKLKDNGK